MAQKIRYTIRRGETYHFKLRVDERLKQLPDYAESNFIQFSLRTKDARVAHELAAKHYTSIMRQLADFEQRAEKRNGRSVETSPRPMRLLDNEAIRFEIKRFEDNFFRRLTFDRDHDLEQFEARSEFGYVGGFMIETWLERQKELSDPYNDETTNKVERIIREGRYDVRDDADLTLAQFLADAESACIDKLLSLSNEDRLAIRMASLSASPTPRKIVTVGEVIQNYRDRHPGNAAMAKKLEPALSAWRQLAKIENATQITPSLVRSFAFDLAKVPARYHDRFNGMSLSDAILANSQRAEPYPTLAIKTIRDGYIGPLKTAFSTAKLDELIPSNPFADAALPTVGRSTPRKRAFRPHELNLIFQHPIWTGCKGPNARNTPGDVVIRDHYFWPPLISLFSGMRAEEIAEFQVENVMLDHPVPHFDAKGTKTENAIRLIPIHPMLFEIGFDTYVRDLAARGHKRLFPDWPKPKSKSRSCGACQRNFNEHVITMDGIDQPKPSFHAFRKTVRTVMERNEMPEGYLKHLMGHSLTGMDKHYLDPNLFDYREKFIATVRYEGLDLRHLRPQKGKRT